MEFLIYLLIGGISGFFAGLLGIGGGLIVIPCLYIVFTHLHYPVDVVMHLAIGTAFASVIISTLSSALAHHKKGAILWSAVRQLAPFMILGSLAGAWIADQLSYQALQLCIALFAFWTAYKMFFGAKRDDNQRITQLPSAWIQSCVGGLIGVFSAIFGIAGGSLTTPYLNYYGVRMQQAVATSSACGVPISLMGALGYLWFGLQQTADIPNSWGYIHLYAFLGVSIASFMTAKLGVNVAHQLSAKGLKKSFALMSFCIGAYFLYKYLS